MEDENALPETENLYDDDPINYKAVLLSMLQAELKNASDTPRFTKKDAMGVSLEGSSKQYKPDWIQGAEGTIAQLKEDADKRNAFIESVDSNQQFVMDMYQGGERVRIYGAGKDHINSWDDIFAEIRYLMLQINEEPDDWQDILKILIELEYVKEDEDESYAATNRWLKVWGTRVSNLVFTDTGTNSGKGTKDATTAIDDPTIKKNLWEQNPTGFCRVGGHVISRHTGKTFLEALENAVDKPTWDLIKKSHHMQLDIVDKAKKIPAMPPDQQKKEQIKLQFALSFASNVSDAEFDSPELAAAKGYLEASPNTQKKLMHQAFTGMRSEPNLLTLPTTAQHSGDQGDSKDRADASHSHSHSPSDHPPLTILNTLWQQSASRPMTDSAGGKQATRANTTVGTDQVRATATTSPIQHTDQEPRLFLSREVQVASSGAQSDLSRSTLSAVASTTPAVSTSAESNTQKKKTKHPMQD